jgi:hypothetical protein
MGCRPAVSDCAQAERLENRSCSRSATPKERALIYGAQFGIPVIPCNPVESGENSKRPYVSIYEASIDPEQIKAWWTKYPDALIGCPMGRRTGIFVIDPDALSRGGPGFWDLRLSWRAAAPFDRRSER